MSRLLESHAALRLSSVAPTRRYGFLSGIPTHVLAIAVLAALLHMAPFWRAQLQNPPGWTYTGNWTVSPDYMQYRVWIRQSEQTGPLVADDFTSEPNTPHLLVIFYYVVGQVATLSHVPAMFVYAYAGAVFAFLLTLLTYATVREFLDSQYQAVWVFLSILVGGGLGAHLKILGGFNALASNAVLQRFLFEPLRSGPVFEDYRSNYVFETLFDTHFLVIWLAFLVSVLSLYFCLQHFSVGRVILTATLYTATTTLHLYEGPTLLVITAAIAFVFWQKGLPTQPALVILVACTVGVATSLGWQALLYHSSGIPLPEWRAVNILFSTLLIAFPLSWALIAWGFNRYWRNAGPRECFLIGWGLGCVALILAGPFYPYPDRGVISLQIPLGIMAGAIYFSRQIRMTRLAALVAILVLGATPAWALVRTWQATAFTSNAPYMFVDPAHQQIIDLLSQRATANDVLMVDKGAQPWETDDIWLAPKYPGKWYVGHYFLTVDYDRKRAEVTHFFTASPEEQEAFLRTKQIRFLFVDRQRDPRTLERVPGLILLKSNSAGSLFEFRPVVD